MDRRPPPPPPPPARIRRTVDCWPNDPRTHRPVTLPINETTGRRKLARLRWPNFVRLTSFQPAFVPCVDSTRLDKRGMLCALSVHLKFVNGGRILRLQREFRILICSERICELNANVAERIVADYCEANGGRWLVDINSHCLH